MNEARISEFPYSESGIEFKELFYRYDIEIPKLGLRLSIDEFNYGFTLRIPVSRYHNRTEGLCGNCDLSPEDDEFLG